MKVIWKTDDGTVLTLRHISANDVRCLISFVQGLSFSTRYFRFGRGDFNPNEDEVLLVCTPDPEQCVHLLVVKNESEQDNVIASARYVIQSDTCCEFALAVTDSWKHHGVGHQLINALIESAKCRGIKEMYGKILCSNLEMIEFVRGCGFEVSDSNKGSWLKIATLSF